jgi:hypothetical protein
MIDINVRSGIAASTCLAPVIPADFQRVSLMSANDRDKAMSAPLSDGLPPSAIRLATFRRKIEGLGPWARIARGG